MTTATDVLRIAQHEADLEYKESPAGSNRTKYGKWYGLDGNPWCAMFVSWVLHQAGYALSIQTSKGFAWTPAGVDYAKKIKRWIPAADLKPGDVIFFNFDNDAGPEHVGFVKARLGPGHYTTIEGNTGHGNDANGGEVQVRDRKGAIVLGGLRPSYAAASVPAPRPGPAPAPHPAPADTSRHPVLKEGAKGADVKHLQALLHRCGAVIVMDGVFGAGTAAKLKAFQKAHHLVADGVCGPRTWSQLHAVAR